MWPFGNSYGSLCGKGDRAMDANEFDRAIRWFTKAISKDPTRSQAYAGLGFACHMAATLTTIRVPEEKSEYAEYCERAVEAFGEALGRETDPVLKAKLWWQRGQVVGDLGREEERDASWKKADDLIPGFTRDRKSETGYLIQELINKRLEGKRDSE